MINSIKCLLQVYIYTTTNVRICNGFVIKLNWMRYCSCDIINWDYSFDSFPSIFNAIPIIFKIFCVLNLLTLFHKCRKEVPVSFKLFVKNNLCLWILFIDELFNILFLIHIDFWIPEVIQGFFLNLSLHLLTF